MIIITHTSSTEDINVRFVLLLFNPIASIHVHDSLYQLEIQTTQTAATINTMLLNPYASLVDIILIPTIYFLIVGGAPFCSFTYPCDNPSVLTGVNEAKKNASKADFDRKVNISISCIITERIV